MSKRTSIVLVFVAFCVTSLLNAFMFYRASSKSEPKPYISLPEEIQAAEAGDILRVEKVSADTIEIGFNNAAIKH